MFKWLKDWKDWWHFRQLKQDLLQFESMVGKPLRTTPRHKLGRLECPMANFAPSKDSMGGRRVGICRYWYPATEEIKYYYLSHYESGTHWWLELSFKDATKYTKKISTWLKKRKQRR